MSDDGNVSRRISRRKMLAGTLALGAAAAAAAASAPPAAAQEKVSQADAQYQTKPNEGQSCALCLNFQPPKSCKFVQGDVSPTGWCQLFTPKNPS